MKKIGLISYARSPGCGVMLRHKTGLVSSFKLFSYLEALFTLLKIALHRYFFFFNIGTLKYHYKNSAKRGKLQLSSNRRLQQSQFFAPVNLNLNLNLFISHKLTPKWGETHRRVACKGSTDSIIEF